MSTATSGRSREYRVRDDLDARGYPFIMRAAASKGAADLLHGHPFVGAVLVQVGTKNKALSPADRTRFLAAAEFCHALPILAQVIAEPGKRTEIHYWRVNHGTAGTWDRWEP